MLQDLFAIPPFLLFLAGVASRALPGLLLAWLGPGMLAPCLILFDEVIQLSSGGLIGRAVLRCFYAPRFADFVTLGLLVEFRQKIPINRHFQQGDGLHLCTDGSLEPAHLGVGSGEGIQIAGVPVEL